MSVYPDDYAKRQKQGGSYLKPVDGKVKVRFLGDPIKGWIQFEKNKNPVRGKCLKDMVGDFPDKDKYGNKCIPKNFYTTVVWNYDIKEIQILEITQVSIQENLEAYEVNTDYGDPTGYDLEITPGEKSYSVIASPPKAVSEDILKAFKESAIDLNELFKGGKPFGAGGDSEDSEVDIESVPF